MSLFLSSPTLVLAGGELDTNGKDGIAYTDAAGVIHNPGQAGAWNDVRVSGPDAEWILKINTTGWTDMLIRWDYRSEESPTFDLDYRIAGSGNWVVILNNQSIVADDNWHSITIDLSSVSAIENQSIVEFRMYDLDNTGNREFRFDNLELTGVPEPCSITLFALGVLAVLRKRRD